jgi:hypothetical protein
MAIVTYRVAANGQPFRAQPNFLARTMEVYNFTGADLSIVDDSGTLTGIDTGTMLAIPASASTSWIITSNKVTTQYAQVTFSDAVYRYVFGSPNPSANGRILHFTTGTSQIQTVPLDKAARRITVMSAGFDGYIQVYLTLATATPVNLHMEDAIMLGTAGAPVSYTGDFPAGTVVTLLASSRTGLQGDIFVGWS